MRTANRKIVDTRDDVKRDFDVDYGQAKNIKKELLSTYRVRRLRWRPGHQSYIFENGNAVSIRGNFFGNKRISYNGLEDSGVLGIIEEGVATESPLAKIPTKIPFLLA